MVTQQLIRGKKGQYRLLNSITPIFVVNFLLFTLLLFSSNDVNLYEGEDVDIAAILVYSILLMVIISSMIFFLFVKKENIETKSDLLLNAGPLVFLIALIIGSIIAVMGYWLSLMIDNFCYLHFFIFFGLWIFIMSWINYDNKKYHVRKWFKIFHLLDMEALLDDE